jgi:hypothetical protein
MRASAEGRGAHTPATSSLPPAVENWNDSVEMPARKFLFTRLTKIVFSELPAADS